MARKEDERRICEKEILFISQEERLAQQERQTLKRERAYIGRMMALSDLEAILKGREQSLLDKVRSIKGSAQAIKQLNERSGRLVTRPQGVSYESLEVAREERLKALVKRGDSLKSRGEAERARSVALEEGEKELAYLEELLRVREEEYKRLEQMLVEMGADRRTTQPRGSRGRAVVQIGPQDSSPSILEQKEGDERRRFPRANLKVFVGIDNEAKFFTGFSQDISEGGIFVATYDPLPLGQAVDLLFTLPDRYSIRTKGNVSWVRSVKDASTDIPPGMGIRFRDLTEEDKGHVLKYIDSAD